MRVFNRTQVRHHRDRAAAHLDAHDFLLIEAAERLVDRLSDITRRFPLALDLGCRGGVLAKVLGTRGGVETLIQSDISYAMAARARTRQPGGLTLVADEEALPFGQAAFDLVISNLALHWVNDLPGTLVQIRHALKPDGLFLASMFGGGTLAELRASMTAGELAEEGGVSPRVSPFADIRDVGALLQRAGFALPVVDTETITVSYEDPVRLLGDLRGMGETNAVEKRRHGFSRRGMFAAALSHYRENFTDADGRVPASFEVLTMTAWAPDASQPKPLARGSGAISLTDVLDGDESDLKGN